MNAIVWPVQFGEHSMMTATTYIEGLQQAADKAQSAEAAYRREAAARIAILERERAFAFRRMNLMRSVAEAARPQVDDSSDLAEQSGEEIAVARAQGIGFITHAQFQFTAHDPMRLILSVRMRTIFCSGRVAPLKHAIPLVAETRFQFLRVG